MKKIHTIAFRLLTNSVLLYSLLPSLSATAQIIPDNTLTTNSESKTEGNTSIITSGTEAGGNLFHSFAQFSVSTGGEAYFNNALNVENIFSRVTGSSISNIDGIIRANGTTNVFLLNPNGIIFGPNAKLDIGGSFLGSSASSINFANGTQFSAKNPQSMPLLTISVPIGLGFGSNPGEIRVQGTGQGTRTTSDLVDTPIGLRVQPNQTLALVGGDVALEGGTLKTAGGRIELGSVAASGLVSLTPTFKGWTLGYSNTPTFGNIHLSQQATVDASGTGAGDIQVQGGFVLLTDGSQIETSTLGSKLGGALTVTAKDSIELSGTTADGRFPSGLSATVQAQATGNGGDITVETGKLSVRDGAQITATTAGKGSAGNIAVNARDSVELSSMAADSRFPSGLFARVRPQATGNGGDITVETGKLSVRDGAQITASTASQGSAGNITVNAKDSVELSDIRADGRFFKGLSATVQPQAIGNGGNITVETGKLSVRDGVQITATTAGQGSAGNITVNARNLIDLSGTTADGRLPSGLFAQQATPEATGNGGSLTVATRQLNVSGGAKIGASTRGFGNAGILVVRAADSVELSGEGKLGASGLFSRTLLGSTGTGGDLLVNTRNLVIRDSAEVAVSSEGTGNAGNLQAQAMSIDLDNGGITAATAAGEGGNIFLQSRSLQLHNGSNITATAGESGNGGNIKIDTNLLTLTQGSSITANAFRGKGGNIQIATQGLFQSPDNLITATSQLGINGNVVFNALENNLINGTIKLPQNLLDVTNLIAQGCPGNLRGKSSSFTQTGRGGLAETPYKPLNPEVPVWMGSFLPADERLQSQAIKEQRNLPQSNIKYSLKKEAISLVAADTWWLDSEGNVVLASSAAKERSLPSLNCEAFQNSNK